MMPSSPTIKFLYSYNGKILPRHRDGKLRYIGGHTRILTVNRSITFSELKVKFFELCGFSVSLKVKLPTEDLDVLVSVESDEDLANVIAEYDRFDMDVKIRAVCFAVKSLKTRSPVPSVDSLVDYSSAKPRLFPVVAYELPRCCCVIRNPRMSYLVNRWS